MKIAAYNYRDFDEAFYFEIHNMNLSRFEFKLLTADKVADKLLALIGVS